MLTKQEKAKVKRQSFEYYKTNLEISGDELVEFAIKETELIMEKRMDKLRALNKHLQLVLKNC